MQNRKSQPCQWRRRREEYLRASGRHDDLIQEGYAEAPAAAEWRLITGGRAIRSQKESRPIELFMVKGATS
jgi:hypothetical protein